MKIISKLKPLLSDLLKKYSFKDAEKDIKKHLPLIKKVSKKYIEGMKENDPAYRYPSYIFLFVMLALALVEFFPDIVRVIAGVLTVVSSATIAVLRK